MKNVRTKMIAVFAGVAVAGIASAAAASLPTDTESLGASNDVVAACQADEDGDIGIAFETSYADSTLGYGVDSVVLSNVSAGCAGLDLQITLVDGDDVLLFDDDGLTASAGTTTITVTDPVSAEDVEGIAVVISG
jgi:hypothetical protein